jgi:hypothetical protein
MHAMMIDIKKRELFKSQQDLFDFARAYLSEAFPNPQRTGCPQEHVLRSFARNPRQGDPSIADHVTSCSPCFNAYTTHLEQARPEAKPSHQTSHAAWIRWSLVSASIAIVLLIVVYALLMKPENEPSTAHIPPAPIHQPASSAQTPASPSVRVLLDLTTAAPERGHQPRSQTPRRSIPAEPLELTVRLPIGSEAGMYLVSLTSKRRTEWSSAARARIEDGEPVLNVPGDFSHIPNGTYELVVASKVQRLRLPVVIARPPDEQR